MRYVGQPVQRVEDRRILTGRGRYIDDIRIRGMVHAAFVRSPFAHASITDVDTSEALGLPGVIAVLTGADVQAVVAAMPIGLAGMGAPSFGALATDRARHVGDPVAIVVAESRHVAEDAAERVIVDYDPIDVISTYDQALDPAGPKLFEDLESNVFVSDEAEFGDVDTAFADADRIVERTFSQSRVAPMPMETRGAVAEFDPGTGELTMHCNVQTPSSLRLALSMALGLTMENVRVLVAQDVGGAFGLKSSYGRETFAVAAAARMLGLPVKWTEDRYEHMLTSGQAREEQLRVEAAVKNDGTLLGLRAHMTADLGAYPAVPFPASVMLGLVTTLLPGPYRWPAYRFSRDLVLSNKATYVAYRGPWEVETWVRERFLDEIARELGLDPAEFRRRNVVAGDPDDRLISGAPLEGCSTNSQLERALALVDYEGFRARQSDARERGRYLGIGLASFIEPAPGPAESREATGPFKAEAAHVKIESDGHVVVTTAQVPHGQGHQTTLAQIAADEMGVPIEHVRVVHGDTRTAPFKFTGTGGSMASTWASGAVKLSTRRVREKVLAIAAEQLEIDAADLEISDGTITAKGAPSVTMPLSQLAMQAVMMPDSLPSGTDFNLSAEERFTGEEITGSGWTGGTHACEVEVDLETGRVNILRYQVVEDCGPVINPAIVEGQIRGGVAQGIGEVLYEHAVYDEEGNLLTSTFMDYLVPTSAEIPTIDIDHLETDPDGEFGFRGVGEGGAIVAPATVGNAIADALAPLGASIVDAYLPPAKILELAGVIGAAPTPSA